MNHKTLTIIISIYLNIGLIHSLLAEKQIFWKIEN